MEFCYAEVSAKVHLAKSKLDDWRYLRKYLLMRIAIKKARERLYKDIETKLYSENNDGNKETRSKEESC